VKRGLKPTGSSGFGLKGGVFMDGFRVLKGLSLSDKTNVAMAAMSLVSIIVPVVSLKIAAKSYQAAQELGCLKMPCRGHF
jgi:hypothetical protein